MESGLVRRILDNLAFRAEEIRSRTSDEERARLAESLRSAIDAGGAGDEGLAQRIVVALSTVAWIGDEIQEAIAAHPAAQRRVRVVVQEPDIEALRERVRKLLQAAEGGA